MLCCCFDYIFSLSHSVLCCVSPHVNNVLNKLVRDGDNRSIELESCHVMTCMSLLILFIHCTWSFQLPTALPIIYCVVSCSNEIIITNNSSYTTTTTTIAADQLSCLFYLTVFFSSTINTNDIALIKIKKSHH